MHFQSVCDSPYNIIFISTVLIYLIYVSTHNNLLLCERDGCFKTARITNWVRLKVKCKGFAEHSIFSEGCFEPEKVV